MLKTLSDLTHENHELMKDISRLEDKTERLENLNDVLKKTAEKYQRKVDFLERENHRLRGEIDDYQELIHDFCKRLLELEVLTKNQAEVIRELEKSA